MGRLVAVNPCENLKLVNTRFTTTINVIAETENAFTPQRLHYTKSYKNTARRMKCEENKSTGVIEEIFTQ